MSVNLYEKWTVVKKPILLEAMKGNSDYDWVMHCYYTENTFHNHISTYRVCCLNVISKYTALYYQIVNKKFFLPRIFVSEEHFYVTQ